MANALCDIQKTIVRIDDILVTGEDDDEHLANIDKLFGILHDMGEKVNKKKRGILCSGSKV